MTRSSNNIIVEVKKTAETCQKFFNNEQCSVQEYIAEDGVAHFTIRWEFLSRRQGPEMLPLLLVINSRKWTLVGAKAFLVMIGEWVEVPAAC